MTLVQAETEELTERIGTEDLSPEQVVQAVHQLEREVLEAGGEGEELPEDVGDNTPPVLVLHREIL